MKPISIVITTWLREWMTDVCLSAIHMNTRTPYRIILIDNGSDESYIGKWAKQADVYVKLGRNYGLEYAKHIAMQFVESDLFVSMDNDILVYNYPDKDWLQRLVDLMEKYPKFSAIACKPQILVGTGMHMFDTIEEIVPFHHVPGYARIMRTKNIEYVGAWEDVRPGRGHEELWIGDKLEQHNWRMAWANYVECIHLWGREGTDPWGYPEGTDSGHNPVWPMPVNDVKHIFDRTGIQL